MRKLVAGFATSIDGFIQGPKGEIDWIIQDKEQYKRLKETWEKTDALFYGRKTYEEMLSMQAASELQKNPFAHMKHYVFSKTLTEVDPAFILIKGDTVEEVQKIKSAKGNEIAIFGGGILMSSLINLGLVDELVLAICPVLLGGGKPFFIDINSRLDFMHKETVTYSSGLVTLTYQAKKS
jgi:dihydrofolate reductase